MGSLLLLLLLACAACAPEPPPARKIAVTHSLVDELPEAELLPEPGTDSSPRPRSTTAPGSRTPGLLLPTGTAAAWTFVLEEGGSFSLQGLAGTGTLQIVAQEEGAPETTLETLPAGSGPRSLPLPGNGPRLLRLTLHASGEIIVQGPAVRSTALAHDLPKAQAARTGPPNVIIYLVDTLRADHVGPWRTGASITPRIDAFATEATVFENTVAQAPWTTPAVASILTGLGPLVHGVHLLHDKLPPEAVTAAERLHAAGYRTAAFSTNWNVRHATGLDQGFQSFDFAPDQGASDLLNQRVFRWLEHQAKTPFFLYVHAIDPHAPYTPPPVWRERFAPGVRPGAGADFARIYKARHRQRRRLMNEVRALYAAEVAFNDDSFGAFLDDLRRRGLYEDSLILFIADHGEEFDEHHAFGHGNNLYDEALHIPLIVKWPGQNQGQRVRALAQQVDVLPTLLATAGLPAPQDLPGLDLARIAAAGDGSSPLADRHAISHLGNRNVESISAVHAGWKLIRPLTALPAPTRLYDRTTDRAEQHDLRGDRPVRGSWLELLIRREQERGKSGLKAQRYEMDEETRKALEALGYL